MKKQFLDRIQDIAKERSSSIILALDYTDKDPKTLEDNCNIIIKKVGKSLIAIKINFHLLIPLSLDSIKRIIETAHENGLQAIADIKLNDIASTNLKVGEILWQQGFDAIIVNPIVGYQEGLKPLIENAHNNNKGIIFLGYMSHKGAKDGYGLTVIEKNGNQHKMYELFLERALKWKSDGVIIGATKPTIIVDSSKILKGRIPIFCPGVGVQGGSHIIASKSGANFLIIGRAILNANDPLQITEKIRRDVWMAQKEI